MTGQLAIALVGGVGFAVGGIAAYLHLRHRASWAPAVLRMAVGLALAADALFLAAEIHRNGASETFGQDFYSTLLLAALIGLVGVGTHLSSRLRGLDGFLFILAAAAQLSSLTVMHRAEMVVSNRPWFVSHGLAFAVSGTLFAAGGAAGLAYLLVNWMLRRKPASTLIGKVASLESLERFGRWMPIIGFPMFTYGILTGLCGVWHREDIGRTAWYLDMSFVFSLAAWLVYAYLCGCVLYRPSIRGRRAAALSTYGLGLIVMLFLFWGFLSPVHR